MTTKSSRGRPKTWDDETLAASAVKLFLQNDYASITNKQVCETLEIPESSFYSRFGGKLAVFKLALQKYEAEHLHWLRDFDGDENQLLGSLRSLTMLGAKSYFIELDGSGCLIIAYRTSNIAEVREATRPAYARMLVLIKQVAVSLGEKPGDAKLSEAIWFSLLALSTAARCDTAAKSTLSGIHAIIDGLVAQTLNIALADQR